MSPHLSGICGKTKNVRRLRRNLVRGSIFHNCNRIIRLRTMFLLTLPLIGLTGLWQFPIFYGMNLPHECHESNQTFHRHLVDNYTDCMMESTYTSEFEELFEFKNFMIHDCDS